MGLRFGPSGVNCQRSNLKLYRKQVSHYTFFWSPKCLCFTKIIASFIEQVHTHRKTRWMGNKLKWREPNINDVIITRLACHVSLSLITKKRHNLTSVKYRKVLIGTCPPPHKSNENISKRKRRRSTVLVATVLTDKYAWKDKFPSERSDRRDKQVRSVKKIRIICAFSSYC